MNTFKFPRAFAAAVLASAGALMILTAAPAAAQNTPGKGSPPAAKDSTALPRKVVVVFKDGRRLEGDLLSESDTSIKLRVVVAGIKGEADYNRSDIKDIESAGAMKAEAAKPEAPKAETPKADAPKTSLPKPDLTKPDSAKPDSAKPDSAKPADTAAEDKPNDLSGLGDDQGINFGDQQWRVSSRALPSEPNGPKVYIIYMGGEFGRDVSFTPMKEVVRDIKKYEPDVIVCFYNNEFVRYGREKEKFENDLGSFDQLETAGSIKTLLPTKNSSSAEWPKKPRLVSWVHSAMGGAAFLPFVAPEMYYTPDATHGGIGDIEHIFDGVGDERAREKQYSLRQARGEGICELGGHERRIMRAMARTDYVLSYRVDNGVPVWLEHMPEGGDEFLLTDDGKNANADAGVDVLRNKGNDTLILDAPTALKLGISNGTAETLDDLMDKMGLPRNYVVIRGRSGQILKDWSKQVSGAEQEITKALRQYREVRVKAPGDYQARNRARGEQKQLLLKARGILVKYEEALNPRRIGPEATLNQIDIRLQNIEAQQLADKPEKR